MPNIDSVTAPEQTVAEMIDDLTASTKHGRPTTPAERITALRRLADSGKLLTLEPMLPLMLNLKGKPYTLRDHFAFAQLFRTKMPKSVVFKTGRQVSKTTGIASHGVIQTNAISHFTTLYITPLYEQIRRFSNNYVRPFINQSPVKAAWIATSTENSVLQRSFRNQSKMIFSFALLDADRIRGIQADKMAIDEIQDMEMAHVPIIRETMSYSDYGLAQMTGTPKTNDNHLSKLFEMSSQAEWFIPCVHAGCNTWNIPSLEYHVNDMIGDYHDDISEDCPATVCHKCRKPIFPRQGRWVHKYPERRWDFPGYHVPQIIMPIHFSRPNKWAELLAKREGWGNTAPNVFYNEVLGESYDVGQKLLTESELRDACQLKWKNDLKHPDPQIKKNLKHYRMLTMGVDWGGGGIEGVSFTTIAVLGLLPSGKIDCVWGKRLLNPNEHMKEAAEILYWFKTFGCHALSHDYTGAGVVRETTLIQAGIDEDLDLPMQYVRAATKGIVTPVLATHMHPRNHYRVDKTRSLLTTIQAIKMGYLRFFEYDHVNVEQPGLLDDFLNLVEEKNENRNASDIYSIIRKANSTDDFAHSVNLGTMALYYLNQAWPDFAQIAGIQKHTITSEQRRIAGDRDWGWEQDERPMADYFRGP